MRYFLVIFLFLVVGAITILGLRGSKSTEPPFFIFPDMDRQPRLRPQGSSSFFADGRADQPPLPGAVRYRSYIADGYFTTGMVEREFGRGFPMAVDRSVMELGREKYTIFCAVCHGASGDGNGITKSYGLVMIATYHDDRLRDMPEGELFNTVTKGKNNMGPYGAKLRPAERWAVVAYLRALQRAQNATMDDVPQEKRKEFGL